MSKFTDWHLYVGCEAMYEIYDSKILGKITQYNTESGLSTLNWEGGSISKYAHEFKLVLHRLESMTREEEEKFSSLIWNGSTGGEFNIKDGRFYVRMFVEETWDSIDIKDLSNFITSMRKAGYDCDGLIDSSQAIDKATLDAREQSTE
jgi:hypothetical protein